MDENTSISRTPRWAIYLDRINDKVFYNLGGGPRPLKVAWLINTHKIGTFPFLGFLMWWYSDTTPAAMSTAAWVYLALHGSYGLAWMIKEMAFPDPNWRTRITLPSSVNVVILLGLYWGFGWLLISGTAQSVYPWPEPAWFCLCISLCLLGTMIMVSADAQKYFILRERRGLITSGMFRYIRHPNYLGEMVIYTSFALMIWHWFPVLVLALVWGGFFAPNMAAKEQSLARYPEWADYKRRSWWLLPGLI